MGPLEELKLYVDAITSAVNANPKFFASVKHYVAQLKQTLSGSKAPTLAEPQVLTSKIEEFWAQWRPSGEGRLYIPRGETSTPTGRSSECRCLLMNLLNSTTPVSRK